MASKTSSQSVSSPSSKPPRPAPSQLAQPAARTAAQTSAAATVPSQRSHSTPPVLGIPATSPASAYAYSYANDTARSEASLALHSAIRGFATTPQPLLLPPMMGGAKGAGFATSSSAQPSSFVGALSAKDRNMASFREGVFAAGAGDGGGYIPPARAMRVSKGASYGLGAPATMGGGGLRATVAVAGSPFSRRASLIGGPSQQQSPAVTTLLPPLSLQSPNPRIVGGDVSSKKALSPRGAKGEKRRGGADSPRSRTKDKGPAASQSSQAPIGSVSPPSTGLDGGGLSRTTSRTQGRHGAGSRGVPIVSFRRRRNVPNNNGTSIFTDHANNEAAIAMLVLKEEEEDETAREVADALLRGMVAARQQQQQVSPAPSPSAPASPVLAAGSPVSLLPPITSGMLGAVSSSPTRRQPPQMPSAAAFPTAQAISSLPTTTTAQNTTVGPSVDADVRRAVASLGAIKDAIRTNEEKSREAYQRAMALRHGGGGGPDGTNGGGIDDSDDHHRKGGHGHGHGAGKGGHGHALALAMGNARLVAQQEAFAAMQKEAEAKLQEGREAPLFRSAKAAARIGGPQSSIAAKIHSLRADPTLWYAFTDGVAELRREKLAASLAMGSFMADNASPETLEGHSPARRLPALAARAEERDGRLAAAAERRGDLKVARLESIGLKASLRQDRINSRIRQWMGAVVLGAVGAKLKDAIDRQRAETDAMAKKNAVVVFEQMWRRRGCQMSYARAFVVRARFLRRVLTRVRSRIMVHRHADRCRNLLQNVTLYSRILVAFSHFHGRVVRGQRLWRQRREMVALQTELRIRQWDYAAQRRAADVVMHISRLRAAANNSNNNANNGANAAAAKGAPHRKSLTINASSPSPSSPAGGGEGGVGAAASPIGGRRITTLGSVMLRSRSTSIASIGRGGGGVSPGGASSSNFLPGASPAEDDPLAAAEAELEELRAITAETRDRILASFLANQRLQFRLEWRRRDEHLAALARPKGDSEMLLSGGGGGGGGYGAGGGANGGVSARELAALRAKVPPKPRWRMVLSDEVVVNMIRQATRAHRQQAHVSGGSSFAATPASAALASTTTF